MGDPDEGWEATYRQAREEDLPWFSSKMDEDTDATLRRLQVGPQDGPILDIGTGPGTFAIEMAKRKFHVVACDISPSAIHMAMRRSGGYAPVIEWVTADLFTCRWPNRFQLIHDRGVYHSLPSDARARYASLVPTWLRPGGHLLLKTFHEDEPGDWGPNRITKTELTKNVAPTLDTVEIAVSSFPGALVNAVGHAPKAWRALFRDRRPSP